MMRDSRKTRQYFDEYLETNEKRISKFELQFQTLPLENEVGRLACMTFIAELYRNRILALYSSGAPISSIKELYPLYVKYFTGSIDKTVGYYDVLECISLAVLFDAHSYLPKLKDVLMKSNLRDCLTDTFINYLDKSWEIGENVICCDWYLSFLKCGIQERSSYLKTYLEKKWYKSHKDAAWYDNHKSTAATYVGYWCFEVAALTKIYNIQDSPLWEYYPYDLAHCC